MLSSGLIEFAPKTKLKKYLIEILLQSKFTLRGKGWSDSTLTPPSSWCFRLRFSSVAPDHGEVKSLSSLGKQQDSPTQLRAAISR